MLADIRLRYKVLLVPIVIMTVYLILFVYMYQPNSGQEEQFRQNCFIQLHGWLPLMSFWWLSVFSNNYCIKGLNELLKIYSTNKKFIIEKLVSILTYEIYVILIFWIVNQKLGFGIVTLCQLVLETMTIGALFIILFFLFHNVSAATLLVLVYSIYLNFFDSFKYLDCFSIYPAVDSDIQVSLRKMRMCGIIIAVSIPFWLIPIKPKRE